MTLDELYSDVKKRLAFMPLFSPHANAFAAGYLEGIEAARACEPTFESRNDFHVHPVNADGSF